MKHNVDTLRMYRKRWGHLYVHIHKKERKKKYTQNWISRFFRCLFHTFHHVLFFSLELALCVYIYTFISIIRLCSTNFNVVFYSRIFHLWGFFFALFFANYILLLLKNMRLDIDWRWVWASEQFDEDFRIQFD